MPLKVVQSVKICTNINAHLVSNGPEVSLGLNTFSLGYVIIEIDVIQNAA